ncbi:hypothetical protein [Azospirillum sp. SYSU D00513]|uniref:hypothetical protein n=1 Tax=Azospirillum sp. SYSU D00513 TaxID=2812561 RepID=UPI001A96C126|nr:hypothetical protein [Azospirillum sp. SYSU D00513]
MIDIDVQDTRGLRLVGTVANHPRFEPGSLVTTSPVQAVREEEDGRVVAMTATGSEYNVQGLSFTALSAWIDHFRSIS